MTLAKWLGFSKIEEAGFAVLVFGVFWTQGIVELALAGLGVFVAAQGMQKLRQS